MWVFSLQSCILEMLAHGLGFDSRCCASGCMASATFGANYSGRKTVQLTCPQLLHHGFRPVRKSVSVHGRRATLPSSWMTVCASASDRGAGPRTTLPFSSYCDPWQGQQNLFEALTHGTTQPRCVHTALIAKSLMPSGVETRYVTSPLRPCTRSRSLSLCFFTQSASFTGLLCSSPQTCAPPAPLLATGTKYS